MANKEATPTSTETFFVHNPTGRVGRRIESNEDFTLLEWNDGEIEEVANDDLHLFLNH